MSFSWKMFLRQTHRWGSLAIAIPLLIVILTGILLLLKKEIAWIQPPTQRGNSGPPPPAFQPLIDLAASQPNAGITEWKDIERIDIQPKRNLAKIISKSHWEIQVDLAESKILQVAYRRSDFIESLHDGSWFHDWAKLGLFLPSGIFLLILWITGLYLFVLPWWVKAQKRKKHRQSQPPKPHANLE